MLKDYILRILCCVLFCGVVLSVFPQGSVKNLLRTCTGIFLTILLLSPVTDMRLPSLDGISQNYLQQSRTAVAEGEDYARRQRCAFIKESLEAYILDKAGKLGCELSAAVEVDEEGYPVCVVLWGDIPDNTRKKLEAMLWEELGIAKEDQQWNGSQTKQQSGIP